jgi:hypothetical protein
VGRARRTSRRSGADVGLAHGPAGGSRHARPSAYLGIAARIRAAAGGSTWAELGRAAADPSVATARSWSAGACVGRAAAGRRPATFRATAFRATASAGSGSGSRAASRSCSAGRSAVVEFSSGGLRTRASLGRAGRFAPIPDPDGTVVESARSCLEPTATVGPSRSWFIRLGRAAGRGSGSTTDRRSLMERACASAVGYTKD